MRWRAKSSLCSQGSVVTVWSLSVKTLIETKNRTLKSLKWHYSTVRSIKNVAVLTEDGAFALFIRPHPREFAIQDKKNANARESAEGGRAGRSWNWLMHYNHGDLTCLFCLTYTYWFGRFHWRRKCRLWFPRCLPLWAPCYFDYQDFLSFTSDFSFQFFRAGKSWEML